MKKKVLSFVTAAVLMGIMAVNVQADQGINVIIDGEELLSETPACIVEDTTLVPMRDVFEKLGAEVQWDANTKTVTASKDDKTIELTVGSHLLKRGEKDVLVLSVPATITEGRTMVPLRAVSESLDCTVEWKSDTKTVVISTKGYSSQDNVGMIESISEWDNKRPESIKDRIGDENMLYLHDTVRYGFEQVGIPQYVYGNSQQMNEILSDNSKFGDFIKTIWEDVRVNGVLYYLTEVDENVHTVSSKDEIIELIDKYNVPAVLNYEDNVSTSVTADDSGNKTGLIAIADDGTDIPCAYIAIMCDTDGKIQIYSLEYEMLTGDYILCGIGESGHTTYGVIIPKEEADTPKAFLEAVNNLRS